MALKRHMIRVLVLQMKRCSSDRIFNDHYIVDAIQL